VSEQDSSLLGGSEDSLRVLPSGRKERFSPSGALTGQSRDAGSLWRQGAGQVKFLSTIKANLIGSVLDGEYAAQTSCDLITHERETDKWNPSSFARFANNLFRLKKPGLTNADTRCMNSATSPRCSRTFQPNNLLRTTQRSSNRIGPLIQFRWVVRSEH
jgi:hypothetical protein